MPALVENSDPKLVVKFALESPLKVAGIEETGNASIAMSPADI